MLVLCPEGDRRNPCCTIHTNYIVIETLWPHKCKSREAMMLAWRFAQRMLVQCSGGMWWISLSPRRVKKHPVLHTWCFPSWRAAFLFLVKPLPVWKELSSSVLMPGRVSDAGRVSAFQLSLHKPQKLSSKHRWCGFNWLQLSRSLFTK